MSLSRDRFPAIALLASAFALAALVGVRSPARADDAPAADPPPAAPSSAEPAAAEDEQSLGTAATDNLLRPTELGVRMTPRMAQAISGQFTKEMKTQYDLNPAQAEKIKKIIAVRIMTLANTHGQVGRDAIEQMMAVMIENEGRFNEKSGAEFARLVKPLIPVVKEATGEASREISRVMTIKQRLEFTRDVAAFSAGVVVFENRMKKWEQGELAPGSNPFFEYGTGDDDMASSQPADPTESEMLRTARTQTEYYLRWQANRELGWEQYIRQATDYFKFDNAQRRAARAILDDCRQRAKQVKTAEWTQRVKDAYFMQYFAWQLPDPYNGGPWSRKVQNDLDEAMQPLTDLENELKRRVDELPTTQQREAAQERAREQIAKSSRRKPPTPKTNQADNEETPSEPAPK